jgi:hypothetical protein
MKSLRLLAQAVWGKDSARKARAVATLNHPHIVTTLRPSFAAEACQEDNKRYDAEDAERILQGLRRAGLEIAR